MGTRGKKLWEVRKFSLSTKLLNNFEVEMVKLWKTIVSERIFSE